MNLQKAGPERKEFQLGSVVLSAQDGTLSRLGYNVKELSVACLGVVTEVKSSKCLVYFPELKLQLWLGKNELADVETMASRGIAAFGDIVPKDLSDRTLLVWWISKLCEWIHVKMILGFESSNLNEMWDHKRADLEKFYSGDAEQSCLYLGLGIEELNLTTWRDIEKRLGDKLLFARFLPAGMHKLEVALYLRA